RRSGLHAPQPGRRLLSFSNAWYGVRSMRLDIGAYRRFLLFATVCVAIAGCAESGGRRSRLKKMIPASGAVTYKGQPIQRGTLRFSPVDPDVSVAATAPIIDGHYQTEPGSGLTAGDYKVVVTALDVNALLMAESKFRADNAGNVGANRGAE